MAIETGKFISKELKIYISKWTTFADFREVAEQYNISTETVRTVCKREKKINETNKQPLIDVLRIAISNRNGLNDVLVKAHKQVIKIINKYE